MLKTRKITLCGIYSALACITFMLENLFPPLIIPGAKLGLSNLFVLLSLLTVGKGAAFITLFIKIIVGSLVTGFSSIMYSLPAGVVALGAEILLAYYINSSLIAASVAGAVLNSTVQNVVFCLISRMQSYLVYLPYLALISVIAGLAVGFALTLTIKKLPDKLFKEDLH